MPNRLQPPLEPAVSGPQLRQTRPHGRNEYPNPKVTQELTPLIGRSGRSVPPAMATAMVQAIVSEIAAA